MNPNFQKKCENSNVVDTQNKGEIKSKISSTDQLKKSRLLINKTASFTRSVMPLKQHALFFRAVVFHNNFQFSYPKQNFSVSNRNQMHCVCCQSILSTSCAAVALAKRASCTVCVKNVSKQGINNSISLHFKFIVGWSRPFFCAAIRTSGAPDILFPVSGCGSATCEPMMVMGVLCTFNRCAVRVLLTNWIFDLMQVNLVMLCNVVHPVL